MNALSDEMEVVRSEYINAHKPCDINDKVQVVDRKGNIIHGIVTGFKIDYLDEVVPLIKKLKKDSTASTHNVYVRSDYKVHYPEKTTHETT